MRDLNIVAEAVEKIKFHVNPVEPRKMLGFNYDWNTILQRFVTSIYYREPLFSFNMEIKIPETMTVTSDQLCDSFIETLREKAKANNMVLVLR